MKRRLLGLAVFATLAATGCHTYSDVGGPCQSNRDCLSGLICATNYPYGYCFEDCTAHGQTDCGSAATACVTLPTSSTSECYAECDYDTDCRVDYICEPISGLPGGYFGVCLPR